MMAPAFRNFRTKCALLCVCAALCSPADATLYVEKYNATIPSMPAMFGGKFSTEVEIEANLQLVAERPLFCKDEITTTDLEPFALPTPKNGLPIALLAQRGKCTFYEKATEASRYGENVKYLVVFDDQVNAQLVPMSSEFATNMSLLFVSYQSGVTLRSMILNETNPLGDGPANSSLTITMDGVAPALRPPIVELDVTGYLIAAVFGFLTFLIFFGCILLCAQIGLIPAQTDEQGRIILFAGGNGTRAVTIGILAPGLLTEDQVRSLEEEEFQAPTRENQGGEDNEAACCCAICLEEFEDKEMVRRLPCSHKFHDDCLVPWLTERHASCPLCKFDVMEHIIAQSKDHEETKAAGAEEGRGRSMWRHMRAWAGWTAVNAESGGESGEDEDIESSPIPESEIELNDMVGSPEMPQP